MKITKEGWAVLENDTHFSKWIEETGKIDHGQNHEQRYREHYGVAPGDTVVDIGACLGDTAVPMAQVVGREGRVYAFEPNPEAFACLVYNTRLYPQVNCYPYALGQTTFLARLALNPNIGASHISGHGGRWVPVTTLDSFELTGVRFIKIDVEGFERQVLKGAYNTIAMSRPKMLIETAVHAERYSEEARRWLYRYLEDELCYSVTPHFLSLDDAPQYDIFAQPPILCLTNECEDRTTLVDNANDNTKTERREGPSEDSRRR